jgi:hypothetical protein
VGASINSDTAVDFVVDDVGCGVLAGREEGWEILDGVGVDEVQLSPDGFAARPALEDAAVAIRSAGCADDTIQDDMLA